MDRLHPARLSVSIARKFGYALYPLHPKFPVDPPIIGRDLLILSDPEFQRSVRMVREHTLLDVARLANLWNLARQTGPGTMLEVGTFRGGGALHLAIRLPSVNSSFSILPGISPAHARTRRHFRKGISRTQPRSTWHYSSPPGGSKYRGGFSGISQELQLGVRRFAPGCGRLRSRPRFGALPRGQVAREPRCQLMIPAGGARAYQAVSGVNQGLAAVNVLPTLPRPGLLSREVLGLATTPSVAYDHFRAQVSAQLLRGGRITTSIS